MHATCYIRDVVPRGLERRLIAGAEELYEFDNGMMIDGYSRTIGTDILHTPM